MVDADKNKSFELVKTLQDYKEDGRLENLGVEWVIQTLTKPPPEGANYERPIYSKQEILDALKEIEPDLVKPYLYVETLLINPNLMQIIQEELEKEVVHEYRNRHILFLVVLSTKLLERPLGAILLGASSSGKSLLMKQIEKHFPKGIDVETVTEIKETKRGDLIEKEVERPVFKSGFGIVNINDLTVAALTRISQQNRTFFKNKSIMMYELPQNATDEQKQVQQILRQLISEGQYSRMIVGEDRKPIFLNLIGHPGFISADANQKVEEQLANRVFLLSPDESQEQTKRIQMFQGLQHGKPWRFNHVVTPSTCLQTIIDNLKDYTVFNDWYEEIVDHIHQRFGAKIQTRRMNELFFNFVEMVTLVMQHRRKKFLYEENKEFHYLKAESQDIKFAFDVLNPVLEQTVTRVMKSAYLYLDMIKEHFPVLEKPETDVSGRSLTITQENPFTRQQLAKTTGVSAKTLYPHLWNLVQGGFLRLDSEGKPYKYWLPIDNPSISSESVLECLRDIPPLELTEKELDPGLKQDVSMSVSGGVSDIEPDFDTILERLQTSSESIEIEHDSPNEKGKMSARHPKTSSTEIVSKMEPKLEIILGVLQKHPEGLRGDHWFSKVKQHGISGEEFSKYELELLKRGRIYRDEELIFHLLKEGA